MFNMNRCGEPDQYGFGAGGERAEICTLGRFIIRRGDKVLSESAVRAEKVWTLFKYLLTCRGKAHDADKIMAALWPGQEYKDPSQALRSLVYRLRRLLTDNLAAPELAANIVFAHGCYRWSESLNNRLDVDEFERQITAAAALRETDPRAAICMLQKALSLYLGDYLPDCAYQEWVLPSRTYYHHLYVKNAIILAKLLRSTNSFPQIVSLCRAALEIEYFEEELHLYYLEALIEEGRSRQARRHYEAATTALYRETGAKPSAAMRQLYGRIGFVEDDSFNLNLSLIQEQLKSRESAAGAFVCDPELFHYFYQLERSRRERSGQGACLALLALTGPALRMPPRERVRSAMDTLLRILRGSLRKGDIVCRMQEAQCLIILQNVDQDLSSKILSRIGDKFQHYLPEPDLILHRKCQPLPPGNPPVPNRGKQSRPRRETGGTSFFMFFYASRCKIIADASLSCN